MKKHIVSSLILIALMIGSAGSYTRTEGVSQDGQPSLQETTDWLKTKLADNTKLVYYIQSTAMTRTIDEPQIEIEHNLEYSSLSLDQCHFSMTETHSINGLKRGPDIGPFLKKWHDKKVSSYDLSLSDIDPNNVKVDEYKPDIPSGHVMRHFRHEDTYVPLWELSMSSKENKQSISVQTGTDKGQTNKVQLVFQDREMAKRISSAFKRAAELCNGSAQ